MNFSLLLQKSEQIKELAAKENTGTPKELAIKLDISERSLSRIIKALKDNGYPIEYSISKQSYVLKQVAIEE